VYLILSFTLPNRPIKQRAAMAVALAFAIKLSHLYQAAWIDSIRLTTLGGLIPGFEFTAWDLLRYTVGVLFCVVFETALTLRFKTTSLT
jgi:hypothetical protein